LDGREDAVSRMTDKLISLLWETVGKYLAERNRDRLSRVDNDSVNEIKGPSRVASKATIDSTQQI
jgi:hypothetical protein